MTVPIVLSGDQVAVGIANQTAWGTPATAPKTIQNVVSSSLGINSETFTENYAAGQRAVNPITGKSEIKVGGDVKAQATARDVLMQMAYILGSETVGTVGANSIYPRTLHEADTAPPITGWSQVGGAALNSILKYTDGRMSKWSLDISRTDQVAKTAYTLVALSAMTAASIPTATYVDKLVPFELCDLVGSLVFGGAHGGAALTNSQLTNLSFAIDCPDEPYLGELPTPSFMIQKSLTMSFAATVLATAESMQLFNLIHFGTASPSAGQAPISTQYQGALSFALLHGAAGTLEDVAVSCPAVNYNITNAIEGSAEGQAVELSIAGTVALGVGQSYQITVLGHNLDSAAYIAVA